MKNSLLLISLLLSTSVLVAQPSRQQMIEDTVVGWFTKLTLADKPVKPLLSGGQTFSIRQQEITNLFVQWMQQTYTPVSGIGVFRKRYYARKDQYFPHAYSAFFQTFDVDFRTLDKQGHFLPEPETGVPFQVVANWIAEANPAYYLNTPSQYLFTLVPEGYMDGDAFRKNFGGRDPKIHPNVYKYLTVVSSGGLTVYLVPGNKLPIRQLTKGEFIQLSDESFDRYLQQKKEDVARQFPSEKAQGEVMVLEQEKVKTYREKLKALRAKYSSKLNEPAVIQDMQPTIHTVDGFMDPFQIDASEKELGHAYGVYTYESTVNEKCLTDQPQWIAINFPYATKEDGRKKYELYRAITEHFNFDYVYDYFFDPSKVQGQPYKPVNEALLKATLANYSKRAYWKNAASTGTALPAGVLFQDDFANNEPGTRPNGWFFSSFGKASRVTTLKGFPGNWVQIGYNNKIDPTTLKKPLPENFTLDYDLATSPDFTTRTGGAVRLTLEGGMRGDGKTAATSIRVDVTSGNEANFSSNYRGQVKIEVISYPVDKSNFQMDAGGESILPQMVFTNRRNKVHVTLQKRSDRVTLFINDKQVATTADFKTKYGKPCAYCLIPTGIQFTTINWENISDDSENIKAYISNVKITKD
ncbi:hypothetical protein [Spirosoma pollinicola]|uniref:Uncharacterized protein n=1 Tax=Spirosoma pollinicola TaxID=2057025 RepID=A0A2K8YSP6_9BACT|nr:hypothetical protein [Spirosoma pollinicola]AUD00604.1 hypothetical protein CWM47_01480 [Spirosoma pollinicola]